MTAELSWTPQRSVFLRRIGWLALVTFLALTAAGLGASIGAGLPRVWVLPTALLLTLGFLFDDLISWRGSRFDRWLLRDGHFIHEGPDGTAMVPLRDITRVAPRTGRGVIVQLRDGRRLNLRYLPHPRETAAQIAGLLPPGTGTARN